MLDHDVEAIIRTHAKNRRVAAWFEDTAEAFEEIGEIDLAIEWARQGMEFDLGHQSLKVADYWCNLYSGTAGPCITSRCSPRWKRIRPTPSR